MTNRDNLLKALRVFQGYDALEKEDCQKVIHFIETEEGCFFRSLLKGHVTGSAVLLSFCGKKILLNRHKVFDRWIDFGGHADGEPNIFRVAARELEEESGIVGIPLLSGAIFDIGVHPISFNPLKKEPEHIHYDIAYLFRAPENATFIMSDESLDMKWVTFEETRAMPIDARMRRKLEKIKGMDL